MRPFRILVLLFVLPLTYSVSAATPQTSDRQIVADVSRVEGPHTRVPLMAVGAGRANEGLRADWQEQLAEVQQDIGFRYVRMHGVLTDDMGVYNEDASGRPMYNFQYVDALYDALQRLKIRPFVELGFMPAKLASGTKTIFWWKGNVTPPKDQAKWSGLIHALIAHWRDRYGTEEIRTWYYEIWNEPDLSGFFSGTLDDYLNLYKTTAEAIRGECADCRVGGPATAMSYDYEQKFVKFCVDNHVPVDFLSAHVYGVKQGYLDETGNAGTVLDPSPDSVVGRMEHSRELVRQSAMPKLQLHFTEWSSAYTPTDYMHDQYHQASFILDKIKHAWPYVDSMSYWTFTDIFEEGGPRFTPFHGGFGLMNYQGIRKPAFYAYQYLSKLGTTDVVDSDPQSWITTTGDGQVQVLLWDYSPEVPPQGQNDQTYYKQNLPAHDKGKVHLELSHLANGRYGRQIYRIGYGINDAYSDYLAMGAGSQLTPKQVRFLKEKDNGAAVAQDVLSIKDGRYSGDLPVRTNDVYLVVLTRLAEN